MVERVVKAIVSAFDRNLSLSEDQREVAEYALYHVLITAATLLGAIVVGVLVGALAESMVALVTGAVLRWSTGGAHLSRPTRCVVMSVAAPVLAGLLARALARMLAGMSPTSSRILLLSLIVLLALVSVAVIQVYAPADTENKPIPDASRPVFRRRARLSLLLWVLVCVAMVLARWPALVMSCAVGLAWQMFSVTPPGYTVYRGIDGAFGRVRL